MTSSVALGSVPACRPAPDPADLVLVGGNVVTLDPARPRAEALAVKGDRIAAVGTDEEIRRLVGPATRVLDLGGRLAVPGLIEGHAHFLSLGQSKRILELGSARTWDEVVARVGIAAKTAAPGSWILGRGWHQEKWSSPASPSVEGLPTRDALDRAAPRNPVFLRHASGHASIVNALALERAGIGKATADPDGGRIVRDAAGRPTGALIETADDLVQRAIDAERARLSPEERGSETRRDAELAASECLSKGITSFQDAGSNFEAVDAFRKMTLEGNLHIRLWVMLSEPNEALEKRLRAYRLVGFGGDRLTVRAIKRYMDGALGSHGAWLLEPYADLPSSAGLEVEPIERIEKAARLAIDNGFQLCVHAIGDRANRETLDLYERVFEAHGDRKDLRWRIEHAQHLAPEDVPRFAQLGVIAAMQGIQCSSDAPWVVERLGEKRAREGAYAWRRILDTGAVVVNGTDAPVEDVDPIASFYASVTRRARNGQAFFPEQRMTRDEALRSYTTSPAFAAFEESEKGTLTPGKLADVTVLSRDILTVPEEEIPGARAVYTIVGGRIEYADPAAR